MLHLRYRLVYVYPYVDFQMRKQKCLPSSECWLIFDLLCYFIMLAGGALYL
uniref:Uncharacterized protein n=1 Tax=Rhizophora mucronata TaxID=61149 RepID=A0A2P2QX55_RHIMU